MHHSNEALLYNSLLIHLLHHFIFILTFFKNHLLKIKVLESYLLFCTFKSTIKENRIYSLILCSSFLTKEWCVCACVCVCVCVREIERDRDREAEILSSQC